MIRSESLTLLSTNLFIQCLGLSLLASLAVWGTQPRIGIRDSDAYAYVIGARSIQAGNGFRELDGAPLNHWPPGYSLLLSTFRRPLWASMIINYLCLGIAVSLIYLLARQAGWSWLVALSLSLALGSGFFRGIATNAKPDILAYAMFLAGAALYNRSSRRLRLRSYWIWNFIIPFKLIAVVFTPAALFVLFFAGEALQRGRKLHSEVLMGTLGWTCGLGAVLVFNYYTVGVLIPDSHPVTSFPDFMRAGQQFFFSIPRSFLCYWYGSIRNSAVLIPFAVTVIAGASCLATLRPSRRRDRLGRLGFTVLALTWLLLVFRAFHADSRLMGYGLLLLFFGFQPKCGSGHRWILYATFCSILGIVNSQTVNALGANDSRYERLAREASTYGAPDQVWETNSFHIVDIHSGIPTHPVGERGPKRQSYYFWVTLPSYDAIATIVRPLAEPDDGWCEVTRLEGAILFRTCQ